MPEAAGVFPLREHDEKKDRQEKKQAGGKTGLGADFFLFRAAGSETSAPPNKAGRAARNGNAPLFPAKR